MYSDCAAFLCTNYESACSHFFLRLGSTRWDWESCRSAPLPVPVSVPLHIQVISRQYLIVSRTPQNFCNRNCGHRDFPLFVQNMMCERGIIAHIPKTLGLPLLDASPGSCPPVGGQLHGEDFAPPTRTGGATSVPRWNTSSKKSCAPTTLRENWNNSTSPPEISHSQSLWDTDNVDPRWDMSSVGSIETILYCEINKTQMGRIKRGKQQTESARQEDGNE